MEPKLFETWSQSRSQQDLFKQIFPLVSFEDARMKKNLHWDILVITYGTTNTVCYSFKWQYMAGAGAGTEIMDEGGAGARAENK